MDTTHTPGTPDGDFDVAAIDLFTREDNPEVVAVVGSEPGEMFTVFVTPDGYEVVYIMATESTTGSRGPFASIADAIAANTLPFDAERS